MTGGVLAVDDYVDATAMCREAGRKLKHFWSRRDTREFINDRATEMGVDASALVRSRHGGSGPERGTFIHPSIVPRLREWCRTTPRITRPPQSGDKFGHWKVIGPAEPDAHGRSRVRAVCACGIEKIIDSYSLKGGGTDSCGCSPRVRPLPMSPEIVVWRGMISRCHREGSTAYKDYGGRGIKVCERWHSFDNFLTDMGTKPTPLHEIDREDNDRGYEPNNCRWVLRKVNCRNRRSNRYITAFGKTLTLAEWSETSGIKAMTIAHRIDKQGMSPEQALTIPKKKNQFR